MSRGSGTKAAQRLARRLVALAERGATSGIDRAAAAGLAAAEPGVVIRVAVEVARTSGIPVETFHVEGPGTATVTAAPHTADESTPPLGRILDATARLARLPVTVDPLDDDGLSYRVTWPPPPPPSSWLEPFRRLRRRVTGGEDLRLEYDVAQAERGELEKLVEGLQVVVDERDRELAEAQARYRGLLEELSLAAFVVDGDGTCVFASSRARPLLGAGEAAAGAPLESLIREEPAGDGVGMRLTRVLEGTSEEESFEAVPLGDPEGTRLVVTLARMRDRGQVVGTVQRTLGPKLEDRLVQAQRLEAIGRMASALAHQINNPAAAVRLSLETIKRHVTQLRSGAASTALTPPEELRAALDDALEGMGRIMTVLADLLAFADDHDPRPSPCDVDLTVAGAVRLLENRIRHVARLEMDFGARCDVLADQSRFSQVIVNVLSNAVTAIEESPRSPGTIWVRSRHVGDQITLQIEDDGVGLDPKALPQLRKPLVSAWRNHTNTGLGLATCDRVLEQMGGRLEVTARPGGGTNVLIVAPVAAPSAKPEKKRGGRALLEQTRPRVLIVDDERPLLRAFERLLRRRVDVVTSDSIDRLEALLDSGERFDLVVCDLIMPDRSIVDAYDGLRERHPWLQNRFVLCTGGGFTDEATRFVADRGLRMLPKPFSPESFDRVLGEIMASRDSILPPPSSRN